VNAVSALQTYVIRERFDKSLRAIRSALAEMELEVVGEFDIAETVNGGSSRRVAPSKILLVDCPLLIFEALALDRAAAVFFPLHVLVSGGGEQTRVAMTNPTRLFDARFPVGAADPMDRLVARVELALESVSRRLAVSGR
jgi:uncharacterized protein (DUF302 family)